RVASGAMYNKLMPRKSTRAVRAEARGELSRLIGRPGRPVVAGMLPLGEDGRWPTPSHMSTPEGVGDEEAARRKARRSPERIGTGRFLGALDGSRSSLAEPSQRVRRNITCAAAQLVCDPDRDRPGPGLPPPGGTSPLRPYRLARHRYGRAALC